MQVKAMKLPCHLSFFLKISSISAQFCPLYFLLSLSFTLLFFPSLLASKRRNCCLQNEISKLLQMACYSRKWMGWKGNNNNGQSTKKWANENGQKNRLWLVLQWRQFMLRHVRNMTANTFVCSAQSKMLLKTIMNISFYKLLEMLLYVFTIITSNK